MKKKLYKVNVGVCLFHPKYKAKTKKKSYLYKNLSIFTTISFKKLKPKHVRMLAARVLRKQRVPFDFIILAGYALAIK